MRTQEFLVMGLVASRGSEADTMTKAVGENGVSAMELQKLAEKWALEAWTDYYDDAGQEAFRLLQTSGHVTASENTCHISADGQKTFKTELECRLSSPKNLNDFNVALAFRGMLSDEEYKRCLRSFKVNLEHSIKGNGEKFSHMVNTPFGPLTSLLMSQMQATLAWLEAELSS